MIIFIDELIQSKLRKERELQYYQEQLEELQRKMQYLRLDIQVTTTIIDMIDNEKIVDIRQQIEYKK